VDIDAADAAVARKDPTQLQIDDIGCGLTPTAQKACASEKRTIYIMLMTTMKRILWLRYSLIFKGPEFGSRAFHVFSDLSEPHAYEMYCQVEH
jgi:hypothetical protein